MYLKKPNPSQLQAMGSSIKRKDETNKGSVQSAPRVSGKATLSLVIRRTRFTKAKIHQGNYNLEIFLIRPQTQQRNITRVSVFLKDIRSPRHQTISSPVKSPPGNTYLQIFIEVSKKNSFPFKFTMKFTEVSINQLS